MMDTLVTAAAVFNLLVLVAALGAMRAEPRVRMIVAAGLFVIALALTSGRCLGAW